MPASSAVVLGRAGRFLMWLVWQEWLSDRMKDCERTKVIFSELALGIAVLVVFLLAASEAIAQATPTPGPCPDVCVLGAPD